MTEPSEAEEIADRMAARAIAAGDPTGWFESPQMPWPRRWRAEFRRPAD